MGDSLFMHVLTSLPEVVAAESSNNSNDDQSQHTCPSQHSHKHYVLYCQQVGGGGGRGL